MSILIDCSFRKSRQSGIRALNFLRIIHQVINIHKLYSFTKNASIGKNIVFSTKLLILYLINIKILPHINEKCRLMNLGFLLLYNLTFSTDALVETVIHYPLFINAFVYDIPQTGLKHPLLF